jgi:K+-transporting ATPase ATPase A chain
MAWNDVFQLGLYLLVLLFFVKPLGKYMAQVYEGKSTFLDFVLKPLEVFLFRIGGVDASHQMDWKHYAKSLLFFNFLSILFVFILIQLQGILPLNPQQFPPLSLDLSLNTAISFVTNTDWQAYSGESSLSYFTQMVGLGGQNFFSAATGMAILVAFIRGFARRETNNLGNFWVDLVRGILYILLPLSLILAMLLSSQGVIQNLSPYQKIEGVQPTSYQDEQGKPIVIKEQLLPMGPVASQVAIKQLGTNGGGFFNASSAHPFENPTPFSNFLEMLALLLIPAALCYTFGHMIRDPRQGWALLSVMFLFYIPSVLVSISLEYQPNPLWNTVDQTIDQVAGNMEGKETRIGVVNSALWSTAATASSNGSVNSMLGSFSPLGGLIPLFLLLLGEVVFGGVGSGLYGLLILVIITVFVSGLMVGRTPEYLGKKIEVFEVKMASLIVLIVPLSILFCTALAVSLQTGRHAISELGPHGFTEILYAFASMTNNNGSAFSGLNANTPFYNLLGSLVMILGRYGTAIPLLAIAGALGQKKAIPSNPGTLQTHTPLFMGLLIGVILIISALTFLPSMVLGPIVEHLRMTGG